MEKGEGEKEEKMVEEKEEVVEEEVKEEEKKEKKKFSIVSLCYDYLGIWEWESLN
jgi:hypothetical protein